MSFPTLTGDGVPGLLHREAQVCLGPSFGRGSYQFFVSGSAFATPTNVYQDAALTNPYPNTGVVQSDSFGRFPPIYLDGSITYGVICTNGAGGVVWQQDPYTPTMSTRGLSTNASFGPQIAATGEVVLPAPAAGGSQITLKLTASVPGQACIQVSSALPGSPALGFNTSATTGAQTATFTATNKPGTATSSPAGWLPLMIDGVVMYTPIWHGNNFTPYTSNPAAVGETINATSFVLGGNGVTTPTNGTAVPGNWFTPTTANIGSGYFISITKSAGLSGVQAYVPATTTVAPSGGAYVGGNLTANWNGTTGSNYTLQLSTGQIITGCTFTNGAVAFTTPPTSINATPTTAVLVGPPSTAWVNITNSGLTINENAAAQYNANYSLSTSITGTPLVASGTIQLQGGNGVQQPTWNGAGPLILAGNGTATLNGVATSSWFSPTTTNAGSNAWINITRTGGTTGVNFTNAQGAWTQITNGGLTIDLTGSGSRNATGTYQISANSAGTLVVASGSISLTETGVLNSNWSGTAPLKLNGDGTATLNGVATSSWYSPTTANTGSGYWIDITRTGGTSGVNFSAAQGSWTNITNSGLSISLSGTSGVVGTATASGTYQISNSSGGSPVLGSGTISLSISGLTIIHVYTTAGSGTETIPTGTTNITMEAWAGGGGGCGRSGSFCAGSAGPGGGSGSYARSAYTAAALGGAGKTFNWTVGGGGSGVIANGGGSGVTGTNSTITAGTVTGFTAITTHGGIGGSAVGNAGLAGSGGAVSTGGNAANTAGNAGTRGSGTTGGNGGTAISGTVSGDGGSHGGGGAGSQGNGSAGATGAIVFFFT